MPKRNQILSKKWFKCSPNELFSFVKNYFLPHFLYKTVSLLSKTAVSVAINQHNAAKPIAVLFSNNRTCPIIRRCPIIISTSIFGVRLMEGVRLFKGVGLLEEIRYSIVIDRNIDVFVNFCKKFKYIKLARNQKK